MMFMDFSQRAPKLPRSSSPMPSTSCGRSSSSAALMASQQAQGSYLCCYCFVLSFASWLYIYITLCFCVSWPLFIVYCSQLPSISHCVFITTMNHYCHCTCMTWLCICRYIGYHRIMCACTTLKQEHAFVGVCVPFIVRSPGIGCLKSGEPSTGPNKNGGDWRCVFLELGRVQSATAWCMIWFVHGLYFSELSQNKPHGRSRPSDGRNPQWLDVTWLSQLGVGLRAGQDLQKEWFRKSGFYSGSFEMRGVQALSKVRVWAKSSKRSNHLHWIYTMTTDPMGSDLVECFTSKMWVGPKISKPCWNVTWFCPKIFPLPYHVFLQGQRKAAKPAFWPIPNQLQTPLPGSRLPPEPAPQPPKLWMVI